MARTPPTTATEAPGTYQTSALWNAQVKALGDFLLAPPVFAGYQSNAQSLTSGAFTPILLDVETLDSDGGHSTVTNSSRYTAQVAGTYLVTGSVVFTGNATGIRVAHVRVNGTVVRGSQMILPANGTVQVPIPLSCPATLAVGDYVEVAGQQNTGSALTTYTGVDATSSMACFWMSK
jgi:hypothetical protein